MTWSTWCCGVLLALEGLARGALCVALARGALCVAPVAIVEVCLGRPAAWFALPFAIATGLIGQTSLGMLNFLLLQWFGVRLTRVVVTFTRSPTVRYWTLQRWVWPLTGWWSEYRWIAQRRGVR